MKTVMTRLRKLEDRFGTGNGKPRLLFVVCQAGGGLALDVDTCVEILGECGSLPTGRLENVITPPMSEGKTIKVHLVATGGQVVDSQQGSRRTLTNSVTTETFRLANF